MKSLEDKIKEKLSGRSVTLHELREELWDDTETSKEFNEVRFQLVKELNKLMKRGVVKREKTLGLYTIGKYSLWDDNIDNNTTETERLLSKIDKGNLNIDSKALFIQTMMLEANRIWEDSYGKGERIQ